MFFHLGENHYIDAKEILMIIDIKSAMSSKITRDFIEKAKSSGNSVMLSSGKPKSIIVARKKTSKGYLVKAYYSSISSTTLLKRSYQYDFSSFEMEVI
ncbi:MAG: DUF370 domain-containing protein [Peptoclostridium sp.]|uniref:extracellular matrix regulator RemB n=1 Tax=Peptoclostridium sp. TaxID=1904860 RepID=UPI00139C5FDA|nr:extracellular matrix/biofilm biosynthesis regulator RemA family protein [Peptoclostridium sp.]MZQ74781.1 DUF370 domain-containing protein [Peptoclostridium sp.]